MRRLSAVERVIVVALACAGCHPIPVSASTRWNGEPAQDLTVVLPMPCSFNPSLYAVMESFTLSSGRYRATLEDGDGIYFQEKSSVKWARWFHGRELLDGGVYLRHGDRRAWAYYVDRFGNRQVYELSPRCQYRVEL